jgi:hypothetical protein
MAFLANETFEFIMGHQVEIVDNSASTVIEGPQTSQLPTISTPSSTSSSETQSIARPKYI